MYVFRPITSKSRIPLNEKSEMHRGTICSPPRNSIYCSRFEIDCAEQGVLDLFLENIGKDVKFVGNYVAKHCKT